MLNDVDNVVILNGNNKKCCQNESQDSRKSFLYCFFLIFFFFKLQKKTKFKFLKLKSSRLLNQAHIMQTVLHMLQLTVSYLLMLVFMTYNSYLCLAIVLGSGLGYFLFGLKRLSPIDVNEHCH
jgi:hypothetical protein